MKKLQMIISKGDYTKFQEAINKFLMHNIIDSIQFTTVNASIIFKDEVIEVIQYTAFIIYLP